MNAKAKTHSFSWISGKKQLILTLNLGQRWYYLATTLTLLTVKVTNNKHPPVLMGSCHFYVSKLPQMPCRLITPVPSQPNGIVPPAELCTTRPQKQFRSSQRNLTWVEVSRWPQNTKKSQISKSQWATSHAPELVDLLSAISMREFRLSDMMFSWVLWIKSVPTRTLYSNHDWCHSPYVF